MSNQKDSLMTSAAPSNTTVSNSNQSLHAGLWDILWNIDGNLTFPTSQFVFACSRKLILTCQNRIRKIRLFDSLFGNTFLSSESSSVQLRYLSCASNTAVPSNPGFDHLQKFNFPWQLLFLSSAFLIFHIPTFCNDLIPRHLFSFQDEITTSFQCSLREERYFQNLRVDNDNLELQIDD